jgi:hypothetical protein
VVVGERDCAERAAASSAGESDARAHVSWPTGASGIVDLLEQDQGEVRTETEWVGGSGCAWGARQQAARAALKSSRSFRGPQAHLASLIYWSSIKAG